MAERRARTSKGRETASQTVSRAKKMLSSSLKKTGGSVKKGNTSRSRLAEIANQDFVTDKNRRDLVSSGAITQESLTKRDVVQMPEVVSPTGTVPSIELTGAGITVPEFAASEDAGANESAAVSNMNQLGAMLPEYLGIAKPDEGAFDRARESSLEDSGVRQAQEEVNRYQNKINAITAERDAAQLGLEGQGRGITDTIIGGQQARIGREAAIQAMPIQAQLAAASGNLEAAKEIMGQMYQARSADIQADQTYRTNLANSMMSFATNAQQTILQGLNADNAQKAQEAQQNLAYQRQLGLQALEYGQNGLISGISSVDPKSPTFEQDMAAFTSRLRKPVAPKAPVKRSTQVVDIGGSMKLVDTQTGEVIKDFGGGMGANADATAEMQNAERVDFVQDLVGLTDMPGFNTAVGPVGLGRLAIADAFGAKDEFIGTTEEIIKNLTLNTFAEAKDRGMTFGAMSEGEWKILGESATALSNYREYDKAGNVKGYDVSEKGFKREVDNLTQYARLDALLKGTAPEDVGVSVLVNPETNETEYWSLNSFGEPTLIR